jgi:hypothetical protein
MYLFLNLHKSLTASQPNRLQPDSLTASQDLKPRSVTASPSHSITAPKRHSVTASQPPRLTASQPQCSSASHPHTPTASPLHSLTASQPQRTPLSQFIAVRIRIYVYMRATSRHREAIWSPYKALSPCIYSIHSYKKVC